MPTPTSILVADDEEGDVELLKLAFDKAQLAVDLVVTRDGKEAVDYLSAGSFSNGLRHHPALVLLDLKMPCMTGFDVLEWLARQPEHQRIPVVVLSSSADEHDIHEARALGAREYLVKPSGINALTELVRQVYRRHCTSTEKSPREE